MADRALVRLGFGEVGEVRQALRASGLPDELGAGAAVYRLEDAAGTLGWAALERSGEAALLRSVLIVEYRRGEGAGTDLLGRIVGAARADGVRRLWLLTETAAPFFAGLGFVRADRESAPAAIRAGAEFARLCPASAECMTMAVDVER